jgi:hypothetical protein
MANVLAYSGLGEQTGLSRPREAFQFIDFAEDL